MIDQCSEAEIHDLSVVVRPTLFDAIKRPEVLIAMVLANLMSPALWHFCDNIRHRLKAQNPHSENTETVMIRAIQRYVNKHLFHLAPLDLENIWGLLDLDEERRRVGPETVDYAVNSILRNFERRVTQGILTDRQRVVPLVEQGKFPEYEYSNIDVILAYGPHLGRKKHRPLGVTCCADEANLMAALACALGGVSFQNLVIFGAPVHYTPFIRKDGKSFWLNGKREWFDRARWASLTSGQDGLSSQDAFDLRSEVDRILTPLGFHCFPQRVCSISPVRSEEIFAELKAFFGIELSGIKDARRAGWTYIEPPVFGKDLTALDHISGHQEAERLVRSLAGDYPGSIFERALYAFRAIDVTCQEAYLHAALRGFKLRRAAKQIKSIDDAYDFVRRIDGEQSIFGNQARLALPDEVLLFGTGDIRERALLLFCLLRLAGSNAETAIPDLELIMTDIDSFVRTGSNIFSLTDLSTVEQIAGQQILRFGQSCTSRSTP